MEPPRTSGFSRKRRGAIGLGQTILWILCIIGVLAVLAIQGLQKVRNSSRQKAMLGCLRQLAAAGDQFNLEESFRIFMTFDDLVGPSQYVKAQYTVAGEDYRTIFPRRAHWKMVVVTPAGLRAEYDAGDDVPQPDGVAVETWPDGQRFETTWLAGERHGPFRAYYPNGKPWSEATIEHGRVTAAWLYTPKGKKFNELTDGPKAAAAILAELQSASADTRRSGEEKLRAKDYAGAVADLTRALAINPTDLGLYRARADAKRGLDDLDGAISDYCRAEGFPNDAIFGFQLPAHLQEVVLARGRRHQAAGRTAAAASDFRALVHTALWEGERELRGNGPAAAERVLTSALDLDPLAEAHALRADARRVLGRFAEAEADYTAAMELAARGTMRTPVNQAILPAHWRYYRGHVRRWQGDLAGATEDFRGVVPLLRHAAMVQQADAALWLFIAESEQGRRDDAARELAAIAKDEWWDTKQRTAAYLLGEIPEAKIDPADRPETLVLTGLFLRLQGDEPGAQDRLRRVGRRRDFEDIDGQAAELALQHR